MSVLAEAEWFEIPRELFEEGHHALRRIGEDRVEGLLLWAGTVVGDCVRVTSVLLPRQHPVRTESDVAVFVDGAELHRVGVWLYRHELTLVGQVHSHPTDAFHSELDDSIPIAATAGALSLVVPDFAMGPADPATYAVYRLANSGVWVEVGQHEISTLLRVT